MRDSLNLPTTAHSIISETGWGWGVQLIGLYVLCTVFAHYYNLVHGLFLILISSSLFCYILVPWPISDRQTDRSDRGGSVWNLISIFRMKILKGDGCNDLGFPSTTTSIVLVRYLF